MGTRAAAFAGKISSLRENILRIQNGTMPQPTCLDLANMMKYFSQLLHDFRDFKDIENIPLYANEKRDRLQLIKTLPNFDYTGLYKTLALLVDILPLIPPASNGLDQLGSNLLMLFKCLVPFLDQANMETMPYLVTTLFMSLPQSLHKDILDTLCFNLLPFTIDEQQKDAAAMMRKTRGRQAAAAAAVAAAAATATEATTGTKNNTRSIPAAAATQPKRPMHCIVRIEDPDEEPRPGQSTAADGSGRKLGASGDSLEEDQGIGLEPVSDGGGGGGGGADGDDDLNEEGDENEYALLSVTSILMIAFHYITEPMHHSQLVECLMKLKSNVFEDLLYVIAYGTTRARCPAVELLFRYWPDICPNQQDRKNNSQASGKLKHISWQPTKCQNKNCNFTILGDDEAVKMCLDFKISITLSGLPPPMLICLDCVDSIYKQQQLALGGGGGGGGASTGTGGRTSDGGDSRGAGGHGSSAARDIQLAMDDYSNKFIDLLLPMERVSKLCENKKCKSTDKAAIGTCFDIECANYNCKKPIRYCRSCFISIHEPCEANNYDVTLQTHIRHSSMDLTIMDNEESINNFIEAIISLLKEAAPADRPTKDSERHLRSLMGPSSQFNTDNKDTLTGIATEEKQLISQYGIWLMTGLCKSVGDNSKITDELLGRLLGMLFQWFHFTACLPDDQAGSALEKLKGECIKGWIMGVKNKRLDVFISCLLPHPIDCSKIGGHWEVWPDTAHQIKEGFKRLLCLVPYDIITDDVWDEIMPYWMECFRHEVPENELNELKILLSKVFDPELSPLGFETKQMYNFISSRFEDSSNTNQEQTLYWLQIITMLDIPIPIEFLFQMLKSGVKSLANIRTNELNKLKIASRLAALDKMPQAAGPSDGSSSDSEGSFDNDDDDDSSDSSGSSGSRRNLSSSSDSSVSSSSSTSTSASYSADPSRRSSSVAGEDDVLLPATTADDERQSALREEEQRVLMLKERQAQARAAFSAKILQHASMLDAQTSSASSLPGGHSAPTAPTVQVPMATSAARAPPSIQTTATRSTTAADSLSLPVASTHARPLKSTTSSSSSMHKGNRESRHHHHTRKTGGGGDGDSRKKTTDETAKSKHSSSSRGKKHSRRHKKNKKNKKGRRRSKNGAGSDKGRRWDKRRDPAYRPKLKLQLSSTEESLVYKVDNNLVCYILMMDILLKQLDLQEISPHRGLDGKEAQQAIDLLNAIVSTPWIGRHTCCDSLPCSSGSPIPQTGGTGGGAAGGASRAQQTAAESGGKLGGSDSTTKRAESPAAASATTTTNNNLHSFSHCAQGFEHEDSYETCVFCEIISTFHQLAMFLIEFFSPVIEVSICEVSQDAANGEFDGKPDYSRIGLDHLEPSPSERMEFSFAHHHSQHSSVLSQHQQQQLPPAQDPLSPFSPSYFGPALKPEVLGSLPKELQLSYNLLVQFHQYQTPDIVSQLLQMIKLVSLHSQVLSKAAKNNPQFIAWCQHNMLVNKLWSLCQLESSEIARTCVPLLLHCITLPWGVRLFRDLVERDFNSDSWLSRFRAVERVVTIAYFCEPSTIKNSTLLQSTMASAFCYVVRCLDDIEAIVAQRALVALEMMRTSSLKLLLWCLEVQFDYIIADRPMILRSVFQLYNHLRDRRFLTWDFFLNRFDTIFLEAQIYLQQTGEIPSFTMQDLKNTNTKSEIYQKKIVRAKEALRETHHSRSLATRFQEGKFSSVMGGQSANKTTQHLDELTQQYKQSIKLQKQMQQQQQQQQLTVPFIDDQQQPTTSGGGSDTQSAIDKKRAAQASPIKKVMQHGTSTSSRYQSVAFLTSQSIAKREYSKFMTNLAMQSVPPALMLPDKLHQHLPNSFVDDGSKLNEIAQENHVFGVVHRACNEDRDTNHSLIFLLMQFFSKPDPSHPQSVKTLTRSHQIVLRHLNILMGYSIARKNFLIAPTNLRLLPVFNAFLTSLPKVLDFNYSLGTILLDTALPVLVYCPAPEDTQYDSIRTPTYSLWLLNPLMRQSWLMSVMAFLYKYQFGQPHLKQHVHMLMWIVINTLESHLNCSSLDMSGLADSRCGLGGAVNVNRDSTTTAQDTSTPSDVDANHAATTSSSRPAPGGGTVANNVPAAQQPEVGPTPSTSHQLAAASSSVVVGAGTPFVHAEGSPAAAVAVSGGAGASGVPHRGPTTTSGHEVVIELQTREGIGGSGTEQAVSGGKQLVVGGDGTGAGAKVASSRSSSSLRQGGGGGGGAFAVPTPPQASQEHGTGVAGPLAGVLAMKPLVKADTSDSLNVKAKLFQRRTETTPKSKVSSAGSSSTRINMEPPTAGGETSALGGQQALMEHHQAQPQQPMTNTGDERLLPIGLQAPQKTRSIFDLPASERLLPIGYNPPPSSSSASRERGTEQHSIFAREEATGILSDASAELATRPTTTSGGPKGRGTSDDTLTSATSASSAAKERAACLSHQTSPGQQSSTVSIHASNASSSTSDSGTSTKTAIQVQQVAQGATTGPSGKGLGGGGGDSGQEPPPAAELPATMVPAVAAHSTPDQSSKGNRRRFGGVGKHAGEFKQQGSKEQQEEPATTATTTSVKSMGAALVGGRRGKAGKLGHHQTKEYVPPSSRIGAGQVQSSFSSPSLLNEQLAQINRHSFVQEFSDKDLSMCLVILETFIHHEPSMAAHLLPNILRLVARYSSASLDSWQSGNNVHLVGGSMFVARQFIRVALHDLMENNIFHQIFTSHFTGYEFYKSMATALADFPDLNQLAPLSKLFEDLNKQKNLPQASSLMTILENVATYFECIIAETTNHSQATWTNFINNWENFLRKLILALPRYSGSSITTTTPSGRADGGTSSMAHANSPSQISGAAAGGSGSGSAANANQFLISRASATGQESSSINAGGSSSASAIPSSCSMIMTPIMRIILSTSKISHMASCKTIVDPYSKIISYTVLNSQFKYEHLLEINHNCCRLYTRDREKYLIQRTIAYELVQVLKFRFFILEENLLILLLFILQDVGGTLAPRVVRDSLKIQQSTLSQAESYITNVSECLRQYIGDLLEFITDVHAISRINDNLIGSQPSSINRDSFGGHVKAAISQYLALEMSLNSGGDNRTVLRYLPWLYTSPSLQQGPREFIDCVSHIRQLSWIILGSLQHSTLMKGGYHTAAGGGTGVGGGASFGGLAHHLNSTGAPVSSQHSPVAGHSTCQPIPIEKNGNIAEHVQVILAGFAEQSKESVLHMSGLFHAFLLCQLWTMYCESMCSQHPANSEQYQFCQSTLDDFWAKITPGVLRLVGHSRVMSEMVSTHFLQLIESLIESNSSILIRYLPMWNSVFYSYKRRNKSGNIAIRLQKCIEWQPPDLNDEDIEQNKKRLINWLEKVQYKMSHIEIQSSQAAPFYLT